MIAQVDYPKMLKKSKNVAILHPEWELNLLNKRNLDSIVDHQTSFIHNKSMVFYGSFWFTQKPDLETERFHPIRVLPEIASSFGLLGDHRRMIFLIAKG